MKKYINLLCCCLMTACAQMPTTGSVSQADTLEGLKAMNHAQMQANTNASISKIRGAGLKETALSLGAQSGLAAEAAHINQSLAQQARTLDAIYDFNALIIHSNILPPVLLEGRHILNLADSQTIRLSDRTYKVAKQARFITTPPTWRQYLWMDYSPPDAPNLSLLPRTKEEREIWRYYVEKGWNKGREQAGIILRESMARIKEDFTGMVLYKKLLAMNMVSAPFVSHTDLGITGNGDEIHIDDQILRITALPELNTRSEDWKAAVRAERPDIAKLEALEREVQSSRIMLTPNGWHPVITPVS